MFEHVLENPDQQRANRLMLATMIAISTTSFALAGTWTMERLNIERVHAPDGLQLDIAQVRFLPPPPVEKPPELAEDPSTVAATAAAPQAAANTLEEDPPDDDPAPATTPSSIPSIPSIPLASGGTGGIPGGKGCPGGVCSTVPEGTCVGPHCSAIATSGTCVGPNCKAGSAAPTKVEFSALRCLACADPSKAELRKTKAATQKRPGTVTAKFCVHPNGKVDPKSVKLSSTFHDAVVEDVVRKAVRQWRFSPMKVGGQARRACSDTSFDIRFE